MLRIGNIILDVPFFQASLSGYSDYAMRTIARDLGAPLVFAGAMLAKSVLHPRVAGPALAALELFVPAVGAGYPFPRRRVQSRPNAGPR